MARVLAVVLMAAMAAVSAGDGPFHVIVHRSNPVTSLTRAQVSAIYMKRMRSWPGGGEIVPVEQALRSRVREQFSHSIHGKGVAYVTRYWQRLIFAGRAVPPPELRSSAAVRDFVRTHRGAIGYIDGQTPRDDVKVILVTP